MKLNEGSNRILELYHFCLQYDTFKETYSHLGLAETRSTSSISKDRNSAFPIEKAIIARDTLRHYISIIEESAIEAGGREYAPIILQGVTTGESYNSMFANVSDPPISRDKYYKMRKEFFYILSKKRK